MDIKIPKKRWGQFFREKFIIIYIIFGFVFFCGVMPWIERTEYYVYFLGLCLVPGVPLYLRSVQKGRLRRLIENIPTSKIKTGAVGTDVEIQGILFAREDSNIVSPLSETSCAYFMVLVYVDRDEGEENWVNTFGPEKGMLLTDESGGLAVIFPEEALMGLTRPPTTILNCSVVEIKKEHRKLVKHVPDINRYNHSTRVIFEEYCFPPKERFYVLGFAESGLKNVKGYKASVRKFLKAKKMIRSDSQLQERFDSNADGTLDPAELEEGARILALEMGESLSRESAKKLIPKIAMVFRNTPDHRLYLTDGGESALMRLIQKDFSGYWFDFVLIMGIYLTLLIIWFLA